MKRVCGVVISSSTASFVILEGVKSDFTIVQSEVRKITLGDDGLQSQLRTFSESVNDMFKQNNIHKVFIKRPSTSGRFQAKHAAFKIETLIQFGEIDVDLVAAQTIAALFKIDARLIPVMDNVLKYQQGALEAAYYGLNE